jgi:two-component system sensor histidine kinase TctE
MRDEPERTLQGTRSLRSQLLGGLLPLVSGLFLLSSVVASLGAFHHANAVYDRELIDNARALAQRVRLAGTGASLDLPEAAREILQWDAEDTHWFEVRGVRSGLLAGEPGVPARPESGAEQVRGALIYNGRIAGEKVRIVSINVVAAGVSEAVEVRVAETLRKRTRLIFESLSGVLVPQLLLDMITVLVIIYTFRKTLAPITAFAFGLQSRTHRSLDPIVDTGLPTELVPITRAVNDLMARLEAALFAQRRFIENASHQLRTPLTAMKLNAYEAAHETDPVKMRLVIDEIRGAADRAVRLSSQLLVLARAEPTSGVAEFRRFDLRKTLSETIESWVIRSMQAGVDLGVDASIESTPDAALVFSHPEPVWVKGDPDMLAEALNNLIHNAITHAGPGTRITVSIAKVANHRIRVRVDDDGPGIAPEDRIRVLERFQRGAVKSDATPFDSGSGLGLAIVSEIAHTHEGLVIIEDGLTGRGVCISIELPLVNASAASDLPCAALS